MKNLKLTQTILFEITILLRLSFYWDYHFIDIAIWDYHFIEITVWDYHWRLSFEITMMATIALLGFYGNLSTLLPFILCYASSIIIHSFIVFKPIVSRSGANLSIMYGCNNYVTNNTRFKVVIELLELTRTAITSFDDVGFVGEFFLPFHTHIRNLFWIVSI